MTIDESTLKPLELEARKPADRPICRYCHGPIIRSERTPTLFWCPACGMYQTVDNDPELEMMAHPGRPVRC